MRASTAQSLEWVGRGLVVVGAVWGLSRAAPGLLKPALCVGAGVGLIYYSRASAFSGGRIVRNPTAIESQTSEYDDGAGGHVIEGEFVEVETVGTP